MLRHIHVETTMFAPRDDVEQTRKDLCWLMEALTQRNQDYLKQRPNTPRLYKSGVKYAVPQQFAGDCYETKVLRSALGAAADQAEVARVLETVQGALGGEHFCDIGVILELGEIDCDGLACWRAAELRQAGIQARPYMTHRQRPDGGTTYHALVLWPAIGPACPHVTSEDPSLLLGMGGPARAADRAEEIRKNKERCDILRGKTPTDQTPLISTGDIDAMLAEVLGLRPAGRRPVDTSAIAEIERIFRRAA